jgi:alkanesulfonate monooxygenase SsuD/methylene tetrahydromethanopterin reductase-like flavin-dependent oxidoreductase (luciferase family)
VIFTAAASLEEAQTFYRSQKEQVVAAGRNPDPDAPAENG